jgi:hypothetical protein
LTTTAQGDGNPEIGNQRLSIAEEDVLGLDVAMNDALPMCVVQRQRGFPADANRVLDRKLGFSRQTVAQAFAFDERHRKPEQVAGAAGVIHAQDVRMLQPRRQLDFALEALGAQRCRQLRLENLERYGTIVLDVARKVDRRHTATAKLPFNRIATGQRLAQDPERFRHAHPCVGSVKIPAVSERTMPQLT